MCTRHTNCKKYFKKARYLRNHLYKFAKVPYPEHTPSHYMPDIQPDQTFITDTDPEFLRFLNVNKNQNLGNAEEDDDEDDLENVKIESGPHMSYMNMMQHNM